MSKPKPPKMPPFEVKLAKECRVINVNGAWIINNREEVVVQLWCSYPSVRPGATPFHLEAKSIVQEIQAIMKMPLPQFLRLAAHFHRKAEGIKQRLRKEGLLTEDKDEPGDASWFKEQ